MRIAIKTNPASELARHLSHRLAADLQRGMLRVVDRPRTRHVWFGDFLYIVINLQQRRYKAYHRDWQHRTWREITENALIIDRPFGTRHWVSGWLMSQDQGFSDNQRTLIDENYEYVIQRLHASVRNLASFKVLRVTFREAYCPDAFALALCLRLNRYNRGNADLRIYHYVDLWCCSSQMQQMEIDNPRLFDLILLLREFPFTLSNTVAKGGYPDLKAALVARGWPPFLWRLISRHGQLVWQPLWCELLGFPPSCTDIVRHGKLLQYCQIPDLPPVTLVKAWSDLVAETDKSDGVIELIRPLFKQGWLNWNSLASDSARSAWLSEFREITKKWIDLLLQKPKPLPNGAGWVSLASKVKAIDRYYVDNLSTEPWPMPTQCLVLGDFKFSPILNQRQAYHVGINLHNCLVSTDGFTGKRIEGKPHYVLSFNGKMLAVLRLTECGHIDCFKASCNEYPKTSWWTLAEQLATWYRMNHLGPVTIKAVSDSEYAFRLCLSMELQQDSETAPT